MLLFVLGIVLLMSADPLALGQDTPSQLTPKIRVTIPQEVPSELAHITYFIIGPFGGYKSEVTAEKSRAVYEIAASWNRQPADHAKLIAYLPGCQIELFDFPIQDPVVSKELQCVPLAKKYLRGRIVSASIPKSTEVEVTYEVLWELHFFGVIDGPVTAIRITTAIPDVDGNFEVALPDFDAQRDISKGEFKFTLRESKTRNIVAFLRPEEDAVNARDGVEVGASYPSPIRFAATAPR